MGFLSIRVVLPLALLAGLGQAQTRKVCLDNQADLKAPALGSFYTEFRSLVGSHGVALTESACPPDAIHLALYPRAAVAETDVLGAARVEGDKVEPKLEIYLDRVVALMPESHCWDTLGRALARVAAHEVAHYIDQDQRHADTGLLRAQFSGEQLASEDSYPFRWIPAEH